MTLTADKLRAVVNLLSDPLQAHAAAAVLAREAEERKVLVADLIAQTLAPVEAPPTAPVEPPRWRDVDVAPDRGPYVKRIDSGRFGLVGVVARKSARAWLVEVPPGGKFQWLPKSRCELRGEDVSGRGIFVVPSWLASRIGLVA
jgi:hypothetical protein